MKIAGFDWDDGNWPKCGKHGVSQKEIEEVFIGTPAVLADPFPDETRQRAIGKSATGRYVFVVFMLLGGLGALAWYGWRELRGIGDIADYAGPGEAALIIEVADGATTAQIGTELAKADVVASGAAFVRAARCPLLNAG